jgi:hypothetical protein
MKKVVLFALLLAAALSAQAITPPRTGSGNKYGCTYQSYSGPAVQASDGGYSYWVLSGTPDLLRGTEYFLATWRYGEYVENYKAAWAKPVDIYDPSYGPGTRWEFTFNPYGPQCKKADVFLNGLFIRFQDCTDGHSRTCWLY